MRGTEVGGAVERDRENRGVGVTGGAKRGEALRRWWIVVGGSV